MGYKNICLGGTERSQRIQRCNCYLPFDFLCSSEDIVCLYYDKMSLWVFGLARALVHANTSFIAQPNTGLCCSETIYSLILPLRLKEKHVSSPKYIPLTYAIQYSGNSHYLHAKSSLRERFFYRQRATQLANWAAMQWIFNPQTRWSGCNCHISRSERQRRWNGVTGLSSAYYSRRITILGGVIYSCPYKEWLGHTCTRLLLAICKSFFAVLEWWRVNRPTLYIITNIHSCIIHLSSTSAAGTLNHFIHPAKQSWYPNADV